MLSLELVRMCIFYCKYGSKGLNQHHQSQLIPEAAFQPDPKFPLCALTQAPALVFMAL